ncbi:AP2 domain-containing [Cryptosporidium sp. chipmunk genotype I]|uniref:AP2 domain-containing n=1 Tax=Cryptosporidium sp. chipmunk genotype I TaxID=1280935 RepID=UPI00351A8E6C|nr:AP2 domain-containing [Cryptosporidium sp. chipmunk genotype I]
MEKKLETEKVFIDKEIVDWSQYTTMDSTQEDTPTCGIGENFDKSNQVETSKNKIQQVKAHVEKAVELPNQNCNGKLEDSNNVIDDASMEQNHAEVQDQEGNIANKDETINDEESKSDEEKNSEEGVTTMEVGRKDFNSSIVSTKKGTGTRLRRAEHQSGVPGVYWQESSQRWIAQWSDSISGRRITHGFSARVYGFEDAKQMAIKSRVDAIENGKATARKLHETSLTGKMYLNMNKGCYMGSHQSETGVGTAIGSHNYIGGIKGMRVTKYGGTEYERPEYLLKEDRSIVTNLMEKKNIQKIMNSMSDEGIGLLIEEMKHLKEDTEYEGIFWHPINKVWIGVWLDSITHETCTQSFPHEIGEDGIDISRLKAIEWRVKLINEKKLRDNVVEYVNNKEFKYHSNYPGSSGITNSCYNILNNYDTSGIMNPLNSGGNSSINNSSNSSSSLINLNGPVFSALNGLFNNSNNSTEGNSSTLVQNSNYQLFLNQLMQYSPAGNNNNNNNTNTGTNNSSFNGALGTNSNTFGAGTGNIGTNMVTDFNMILSNMLLLNGGGVLNGSKPSNISNSNNMNVNTNSMISNYLNSYYSNMLKQQLFGDNSEGLTTKNNNNNNTNGHCNNSPSLNTLNSVDLNYLSPSQILNDSAPEGMAKNKMMNSLLIGSGINSGAGGYFCNYSNLNNVNFSNIFGINQICGANGVINNTFNSGNTHFNHLNNQNNQYMYNILQNLVGSNKLLPIGNNNFGSISLDHLDQFQNIPINLTESVLLSHLSQTQSQAQNQSHYQTQSQGQQNNSADMDINGMIKKIISQESGVLIPRSDANMGEAMMSLEKIDSLKEEIMSYNQGMSNLLTSFEPLISGSSSFNNNNSNSSNNSVENNANVTNESLLNNYVNGSIDGNSGGIGGGNINIIGNNGRSNGDIADNVMDEKKISRSVTSSSVDSSISSNSTSFSMIKDSSNILDVTESTAPTVSSTPASSSISKMKAIISPKKRNLGGISYKSGIPGVYWKTRDQEWVAEWYDQNRKRHSRHFYVKKYGFNEAKKLAIQCRLNAVNSGEAVLRSGGGNNNNISISGHRNANGTIVANAGSKASNESNTNTSVNTGREGEKREDSLNSISNQIMAPIINEEVESIKNGEEAVNTNLP